MNMYGASSYVHRYLSVGVTATNSAKQLRKKMRRKLLSLVTGITACLNNILHTYIHGAHVESPSFVQLGALKANNKDPQVIP